MSFLAVGSQGRTATIANLLSQPFSFGLDRDGALAIVTEIAMTIKRRWQTVFRSCGVPERLYGELARVSFANALNFDIEIIKNRVRI
ncbi:hypothetical protein [Desulfobacter latus]|uniref:Uncharacterized protein n=1 Tax=Desulfobacter latus TaxID=2292 RepID=A0A850TE02_9BACT|nr:hypothetical protein [Desulfobacter latus]NWH06517.1 hypothetical protein [Desulfobacter latus]